MVIIDGIHWAKAARIFAAGAGVAGAYWPRELDSLALSSYGHVPEYLTPERVQSIADWCTQRAVALHFGVADIFEFGAFVEEPKSAIVDGNSLIWRTSVDITLAYSPYTGCGWRVSISGPHELRETAMRNKMLELSDW